MPSTLTSLICQVNGWLVKLGACNEFVYSEEGLTWADVEEATGAAEHPGPSTRSGHARPFTIQAPVEVVQEQQQEEEAADTNTFAKIYRRKKQKRN